jgi:hypothetical protein
MTSLKLNFGPDISAEADWFTVLVGAGLTFALTWLFLHYLSSKTSPMNSWDMPVVGSGTADEPSRVELLPRSPILISD